MIPQTEFCRTLGIEVPLICGAMYPCSNPELVAAVSEAGGIGIVLYSFQQTDIALLAGRHEQKAIAGLYILSENHSRA